MTSSIDGKFPNRLAGRRTFFVRLEQMTVTTCDRSANTWHFFDVSQANSQGLLAQLVKELDVDWALVHMASNGTRKASTGSNRSKFCQSTSDEALADSLLSWRREHRHELENV